MTMHLMFTGIEIKAWTFSSYFSNSFNSCLIQDNLNRHKYFLLRENSISKNKFFEVFWEYFLGTHRGSKLMVPLRLIPEISYILTQKYFKRGKFSLFALFVLPTIAKANFWMTSSNWIELLHNKTLLRKQFFGKFFICKLFFLISENHCGQKCPKILFLLQKTTKSFKVFYSIRSFYQYYLEETAFIIYLKINSDISWNLMHILTFQISHTPQTKFHLTSTSATLVASIYIQKLFSQFFWDFIFIFANVSKTNLRKVASNNRFIRTW